MLGAMKNFAIKMLATWFGTGYLKPAPGTWGTLGGLITLFLVVYCLLQIDVGFFLQYFHPIIMFFTGLVLFFIGIPIAERFDALYNTKDSSMIVIDEVAAFWMGAAFIPFGPFYWVSLLVYFVLFRIFDIWKPWPIKRMEKRFVGGLGVMIDDVVAAIYALIGYYIVGIIVALIMVG